MATLTTNYLESSRIPVKSVSTSTLGGSLLPRPTKTSSRTMPTTTTKQRATTTPRVHRRRTSSSSSNSSLSNNWLTSMFSQQAKYRFKSAIRLYVDNDDPNWQVSDDTMRYIGTKSTKKFEFDHVFRGSTSNQKIFETCVKSTVQNVMKGLSGTVFTYGQPGSGKTQDNDHEYILSLSYFEISNEIIRDLLVEGGTALKISDENKRRGAYVSSLREQIITCSSEALQYLQKGEANRYLLSSNYDSHHSRSHTFTQVTVERRELPLNTSSNASVASSTSSNTSSSTRKTRVPKNKKRETIQISYLYLIDLASNDKSIYQVLKSPINKSCMALEAIVHNLSETGKTAGHPLPPYHDSKLTRLLQPSFMGQHNVVCICTVDMDSASQDEIPTFETLNFASRIKRIPTSPKVCEISEDRSLLLEKLETEKEKRNDLAKIKSVLEQRLYCKSQYILTSKSFSKLLKYAKDEEEDPWKVINKLRVDFDTLAASSSTQLGQLKSVMEETRSLPDEIAQLEAELNITRAELQVTQLLVNERDAFSFTSKRQ
ncbi:hypothetical protein INT47_012386 [Mucor saturninus]|uniref:Kinesin motor domain-containing protein n=1 Tax=Mucor saturninus TaxID=64648 RepID=A0A8H7UU98_9FUNG|nr:hypothetical protein INT47_012386 [Mucor saturninus]